jgi:hypothetical protein
MLIDVAKRIGYLVVAILGWLLIVLFWQKIIEGNYWYILGVIFVVIPVVEFLVRAFKATTGKPPRR